MQQEDAFYRLAENQYKLIDVEQLKSQVKSNRKAIHNEADTFFSPSTQTINFSNHGYASVPAVLNSRQMTKGISAKDWVERKDIENIIYGDLYEPIASINSSKLQDEGVAYQNGFGNSKINESLIETEPVQFYKSEQRQQLYQSKNSRHPKVEYFSKKERSSQKAESQLILQKYSTPVPKQKEVIKHFSSAVVESRFVFPNSPKAQQSSKNDQNELSCKIERDGKPCKLCELSRSQLRKSKLNKQSPLPLADKSSKITQKWEEENWVTAVEPRVNKINVSPSKSSKGQYLASAEKYEFKRNTIEASDKYLQPETLKRQFLAGVESRRKYIDQQIRKLTSSAQKSPQIKSSKVDLPFSGYHEGHTRKKIFSRIETNLSPSSQKKPGFLTPSSRPPLFHGFTAAPKQKTESWFYASVNSKKGHQSLYPSRITKEVDFGQIREGLINKRIKQFRSKSKEESSFSPSKSMIPGLRLLQMPAEVRRWYQSNRKSIVYESEKICNNDLIQRYMSESQVSGRLYKLVLGMVNPQRWLMIMINQVYSKLKDRYLPFPG